MLLWMRIFRRFSIGRTRHQGASARRARQKAEAPFATFESLERVVPIVQTQESRQRSLTLASLELYEDGFILRFQLMELAPYTWRLNADGAPLSPISQPSRTMFAVKDEAGFNYEAYVAGGFGGMETFRAEVHGRPAIRTSARRLEIRAADTAILDQHCFEIDLT